MNQENSNLNIPQMTVSDVCRRLTDLYASAIKNNISFKKLPTPFLWGTAGIGKSQGVYQLARKLEAATEKKVCVTDVRLLLFSPVDLRGVPMADSRREFTNWLKPRIFDMDSSANTVNLLFLDELSAAPQSVQAAAYQICLDRKIGEHILPENCIVIAAGNRTTDLSVSYKMPKALCNRLMHFNVKSDFAAWREWGVSHNISHKIIAFLAMDDSRLCLEPESSDLAYPTPRSWEFVSTLLRTVNDDPAEIRPLIAACIGNDTAIEFEAFCKGLIDMPCIDDILEGRCNQYPRTHDVLYALISALVTKIKSVGDAITDRQLENVCSYVQRFPKDFVMSFMKDINSFKEINTKLMKCHTFQMWLNKNKAFI